MKKTIIVALAILTTMGATAKMHRQKKAKNKNGAITSVSMHRGACYGRCPDYWVAIANDGTVTYTAIRFTPDTGVFKKNIGITKARDIIKKFELYRVDTCQEMYENRIPDLPGLTFAITYTTKTKTIRSANFGPQYFQELAEIIDEAGRKTENTGWTRTSNVVPK